MMLTGRSGEIGECAMVLLRHIAIAAACAAASLPVLAEDQEPANSQGQNSPNAQERFVPRLNDIMVATQLRHFKLWYAGIVQNWPLAKYECGQIRTSIADAKSLYPHNPSSNMTMMTPAADDLDDAIKERDSAKFSKAFTKLTAACNSCHEATGFGFIKIRDPRLSPLETSPFSDEIFPPK
jgi:cytochrome c553